MLKELYILDMDIFSDIGGGGRASYDIISGLTNYYKIIFIPKYAAYRKLTNSDMTLFEDRLNRLKKMNVTIPNELTNLSSGSGLTYERYLRIISSLMDEGSVIMDLNYFPEIEPNTINDIIESISYSGEINWLKNNNNCKVIALIQGLDNRPIYSHIYFALKCFMTCQFIDIKLLLGSIYRNIKDPLSAKRLLRNADLILVYSKGSIASLNRKSVDKFRILRTGNTVEYVIGETNKSDYIIYFSRLIYRKGILDLLEIFNLILKTHTTNLVIAGKFFDRKVEKVFFDRIKKLGIANRIKFLGFIHRQDLNKAIANAKVFLYPSHYDSFPYAILESISLSTAVVTYALPTISSAFANLDCIYLIKEFDINRMARKTVEILKLNRDEYTKMFNNERTKNFIAMHMNRNESINEINRYIQELFKES